MRQQGKMFSSIFGHSRALDLEKQQALWACNNDCTHKTNNI